jgi:hypothetical protein
MTKPFKVFGIGLNKTGTSSLRQALRRLGYRHAPFSARLVRAWGEGRTAEIDVAADHYDSFADWPWPLVWQRMAERFGERARFVLTLRETPEAWLDSLRSHSERVRAGGALRRIVYGYRFPHGREREHIDFYRRHADAVRGYFATPARQHLFREVCWERGDGWADLAALTGDAAPAVPFPHANAAAPAPRDPVATARNRERIAAQLRRLGREPG